MYWLDIIDKVPTKSGYIKFIAGFPVEFLGIPIDLIEDEKMWYKFIL